MSKADKIFWESELTWTEKRGGERVSNETASMPKYIKWQSENIREMGRGAT